MDIPAIIAQITLEEKAALCTEVITWAEHPEAIVINLLAQVHGQAL
ncbi:MAG: hypothetical protein KC496_03330 [Anaerolineae bacterium]|nr:hypothetical protein [Anaerolineae bacterium]